MRDKITVPNWLRFRRLESGDIEVKNFMGGGTVTVLSTKEFALLKGIKDNRINALSPRFPKEVLEKFSERGLLRFQKRLCVDGSTTYRTIRAFRNVKASEVVRSCAWFFSMVSMIASPMALVWVVSTLYSSRINFNVLANSLTIPGILLSAVIGIASHEFGHVVSAWGHGFMVFECGIIMRDRLPKATYVLYESSGANDPVEKVQTIMAGIGMNAILSAAFLGLALVFPGRIGSFGLCGSVTNLWLASLNAYSKYGDGSAALLEALQDDRLSNGVRRAMLFFLGCKPEGCRKPRFLVVLSQTLVRFIPVAFVLLGLYGMLGQLLKVSIILHILLNFAFLFGMIMQSWLVVQCFRRMSLRKKKARLAQRVQWMQKALRQEEPRD